MPSWAGSTTSEPRQPGIPVPSRPVVMRTVPGPLPGGCRGTLRLVAAPPEQARVVELFQIQNDEGPCLDCYRTGQAVIASDIRSGRAAAQWPQFAAAAQEMGYAGVHAIPMRLRRQIIGTLNLFKTEP